MKFRRLKENLVYQNRWAELYDDEVERPDGTPGSYMRFCYKGNPPGVVLIPRLPDGRLLLLKIYRYAQDEWSHEFPRGGGKVGEAAEDGARRELKAETQLVSHSIKLLGYHRPDTAIVMTEAQVFLAELDEQAEAAFRPNAGEAISEGRFLSPGEVWRMAAAGEIRDGFTLGALALLQAQSFVQSSG